MSKQTVGRGITLALVVVVFCYVLGFYQQTDAAPRPVQKAPRAIGQPLADAVRLQTDMLQELKAIRGLLEKQNELLKQSPDHSTDKSHPAPSQRR